MPAVLTAATELRVCDLSRLYNGGFVQSMVVLVFSSTYMTV